MSHIEVTTREGPALFPAAATAFVPLGEHLTAHFNGHYWPISETIDQVSELLEEGTTDSRVEALADALQQIRGTIEYLRTKPRLPTAERLALQNTALKAIAEALAKAGRS